MVFVAYGGFNFLCGVFNKKVGENTWTTNKISEY
jgi:hypothetical protein